MRDADWRSLITSITAGQCTLMLGPDAIATPGPAGTEPIPRQLAAHLWDQLEEEPPRHASLTAAARITAAREDEFALQSLVTEFLEDVRPEDDAVLRRLARLPFPLTVNTAPGVAVERAFTNPAPIVAHYDRHGTPQQPLPEPSADAPVVYHLCGSVEDPASLVLSDDHMLDLLVSVIAEDPPLPVVIRSALSDLDRAFLFLGFRLQDWHFRALTHALAHSARRNVRSYAVEVDSTGLDDDVRHFYRSGRRINFLDQSLDDFAAELCERVAAVSTDVRTDNAPPVASRPLAARPLVFICHASEDRGEAKTLAEHLEASDIDVWLDRNDLGPGDRWDEDISHVLTERVDYVLVLQSKALRHKTVGYVNREIRLARRRQDRYRRPRVFLIPGLIDDEGELDELRDLQAVDLTHSGGLDDLVRLIQMDQERARHLHA